ncbi:RNA-binding protein 34 [Sardina pilchardus]|uniref:RNA-binding protein 34 n=1 Tax=Sardina pilchardus TaxID=27697 RepID=UPI002E132524
MQNKSTVKSSANEAGDEAASYAVGQVSGCLFPNKPATGSGSLSALFSSSSTASTVKFVPAPKLPEPKPVKDEDAGPVPAAVSGKVQPKKSKKPKSAAELKLENRESSLQNADDEDTTSKTPKASKRKAPKAEAEDEDEDAVGHAGKPAKKAKTFKDYAAERVKLGRTVFVGNLPVSCTREALRAIFKEHGPIESIRFRSVAREDPSMSRKVAAIHRKVHPKKQSINAYIVFTEKEAAGKALTRNGLEISKNFHIRVDAVSKQHDHKRSIFVGNLPYDMAELALRQHFEDCGPLEAVRLIRDRETGMGKGFGYVLFESPDSVQLALKLDGSVLCQRKIRVKRSVKEKDAKTEASEDGKGQGRGRTGPMKTGQNAGPPGQPGGGVGRGGRGGGGGGGGVGRGGRGGGGVGRGGFGGGVGRGGRGGGVGRASFGGRGGFGGRGRGGQKPFQRNPGKKTSPSTFKGETADPAAKKNKGQKKKSKPRKKKIHI